MNIVSAPSVDELWGGAASRVSRSSSQTGGRIMPRYFFDITDAGRLTRD